jgi:hypothetical protein
MYKRREHRGKDVERRCRSQIGGREIPNLGAPLLVACALVVVGVLACYAAFFAHFAW